ncbi:MAG TPA: hypothetical protein VJO99_03590 [Burkholderiaceae bacterium]|nr:hypothetical protein [Burkholderiaceae bacterium]
MQQRAIVSSESLQQVEQESVTKTPLQPVELTEAQLLQVAGGLTGPAGGWDSSSAGPAGGW